MPIHYTNTIQSNANTKQWRGRSKQRCRYSDTMGRYLHEQASDMTAVSWPMHSNTWQIYWRLQLFPVSSQQHGSYEWGGRNAYKAVTCTTPFFCPYFQIPKKKIKIQGYMNLNRNQLHQLNTKTNIHQISQNEDNCLYSLNHCVSQMQSANATSKHQHLKSVQNVVSTYTTDLSSKILSL